MTAIATLPTRAQQLEALVLALPEVRTVLHGVHWAALCPAHGEQYGRVAVAWASPERTALQVSCVCGTPGAVLAEALGLPSHAMAPPAKAPTFEAVDLFMARTGQQQRWLLEPYVPASALVLIQGAPKSGKTFFAGWLAVYLAEQGQRALFVEEEGSVDVQGDRFRPFLADGTGAYLEGRLQVAFRKRFRLDHLGRVDSLIAHIKAHKATVVFLDPFKLLHQADEQSASELTPVLDALQRIITETGCTVVLIHHTKKGASWDKGDSGDAQSQDARGSGAIIGSVDHVIAIKGVPPAQRQVGQVRFIVECADSRVAQPFDKRQAVVTLAGGEAGAIAFVDTKAAEDRSAELLERAMAAIPFEPSLITRADLRTALNVGKKPLDAALKLALMADRPVIGEVINKGIYRRRTDS